MNIVASRLAVKERFDPTLKYNKIVSPINATIGEALSRKAAAEKRAKIVIATAATLGILSGAVIAIVAMKGQ